MVAAPAVQVSDPGWQRLVLRFWYQELQPSAWFTKNADVDREIVRRFATLWADVRHAPLDELVLGAKEGLAAVLVLDQFPRNMYRGTRQAFESDPQALAVVQRIIALGYDRLLRKDERLFLYLPFEHAEEISQQARSVDLISRLGNAEWTKFAQAHKVIIDRFNRFPHRNAVLGRTSTAEEDAFLKTPGSAF